MRIELRAKIGQEGYGPVAHASKLVDWEVLPRMQERIEIYGAATGKDGNLAVGYFVVKQVTYVSPPGGHGTQLIAELAGRWELWPSVSGTTEEQMEARFKQYERLGFTVERAATTDEPAQG